MTIEQKAVELEPCPFCGGPKVSEFVDTSNYGGPRSQYVVCHSCGAHGPAISEMDSLMEPGVADAAWNTRAAPKDKWQDDMDAAKEVGASGPVLGFADGVQFSMMWKYPAFFERLLHEECSQGGWVAFAYGMICFDGSGKVIRVNPTRWQPFPEPPEKD